jgi:hypothetical protein
MVGVQLLLPRGALGLEGGAKLGREAGKQRVKTLNALRSTLVVERAAALVHAIGIHGGSFLQRQIRLPLGHAGVCHKAGSARNELEATYDRERIGVARRARWRGATLAAGAAGALAW